LNFKCRRRLVPSSYNAGLKDAVAGFEFHAIRVHTLVYISGNCTLLVRPVLFGGTKMIVRRRSGMKLVHWLLVVVIAALSINVAFYVTDFANRLLHKRLSLTQDSPQRRSSLNEYEPRGRTLEESKRALRKLSELEEHERRFKELTDLFDSEVSGELDHDKLPPGVIQL
jgi:hypothetical protein